MIPTEFKDTVARKYGYKHFQELLGVYFKCTQTRIQAMKTTKVYVNDSLVVLYGEWPVEPHYQKHVTKEHAEIMVEYEQALKKAIEEAENTPFEDQKAVKELIFWEWYKSSGDFDAFPGLKPGFYDIQAEVEVENFCASDCCTENLGCEHCREPKKLAVIKPLSNDWNKKESYQEGTDRSVKRVKDILESKPLSSGEKEEQCPKCRTKDFASCHSMYCPMRKLSSVDTNIEEKKIFAPDKEHFDKMLLKELVWKLDREVWAHVPNPEPSEEWTTSKARERTRELIAEYIGDYDKLAAKSTPPVQEKPDFDRMIYDLQYTATDSAGHEVEVVNAYEAKELLINIWKNYVEKQPKV